MFRRITLLIALVVCTVGLVPQVQAADRDIPLMMLSTRDRLLRDRTMMMNQRADLNQRIMYFRRLQADADRILNYSGECVSRSQYDEVQLARSRCLLVLNDLQRRLDNVEKALLDNNKDLSNVEYYIQKYACLR